MAAWVWSVGPWRPGASRLPALSGATGPQVELSSASARSLKVKLLDPSEASFTVSGYAAEAQVVEELITDLWVWRDGVSLFRGRVTSARDQLAAAYSLTVEVRDYREVLNRRLLYADRTWTTVEQSTIAWDLITDTQALGGGSLGLTKGTWPATGIVRPSVMFTAGDTVWDSLKKLGAMSQGFELDIDADLHANLYYPQRGVDQGATLDYGGLVAEVTRTFDPAQFANAIRQSGAEGITPTSVAVSDIATAREGRWDAQFSDPQLTTVDMVAQTAATNLARASAPLPSYSMTLAKGAWGGPGHLWVGDWVTAVVKAGRLLDVVKARVYELDIDVDATDQEDVTVVVGDVALDPRSVLRGIAKRVAVLAKR